MATLDASAARRRPGVQVYSPARALPPEITGRMTAAQQTQRQQQATATPQASPWNVLEAKYLTSPEAQKQAQQQAQDEAMAALPAWKRTLVNVVENPFVKYAVLAPLAAPSRVVNTVMEETYKAVLPDSWEKRAQHLLGDDPKWNLANQLSSRVLGGYDFEKTHDDESVWERLNPYSDTPVGAETQRTDVDLPVATGLLNFATDVATDPLTYVSVGGTRIAVDAAKAASTAATAERAASLVRAVEQTGDDAAIKVAREAADEAAMLARKAAAPVKTTLPHTTKARADLVAEVLTNQPELAPFADEFTKGVRQGFRFMKPEARAALGIDKVGLRLNGTNMIIPGTEKLTAPVARAGLAGRTALSRLPLPSGAVRGGEETAQILAGKAPGDVMRAAAQRVGANEARILEGRAKNLGTRALVDSVKANMKKTSAAQREAMVYEAETSGVMNPLNQLGADVLKIYEKTAGRTIDPQYLRDPVNNVPHITDPGFRRMLKNKLEKGTELEKVRANAYLTATDMRVEDLLETSSHLDKRRVLTTNPDGSAGIIKLGDKGELGEIVIPDGTLRGLNNNESLRKLFPGYTGKFYMDDPVKIFDAYNSSLARDAGRTGSMEMLAASPSQFVEKIEGEKADELRRMNDNLRRQSEPYRTAEMIRANPVAPGSPTFVTPPAPPLPPPSRFFAPTEGTAATRATRKFFSGKNSEVGQYLDTVNKEIASVMEPGSASLYDLRKNMMSGLRGETAAVKAQLADVSATIRKFQHRLKNIGKLTPDTADEMGDMLNALAKHRNDLIEEMRIRRNVFRSEAGNEQTFLDDIEATLTRTEKKSASEVRRRVRRADKAMQASLDKELFRLNELWEKAQKTVDDGPKDLAREVKQRHKQLWGPVDEARDALERKIGSIPNRPDPGGVAEAKAVMATALEESEAHTVAAETFQKASEKYRKLLAETPLPPSPKQQAAIEKARAATAQAKAEWEALGPQKNTYRQAKEELETLERRLANAPDKPSTEFVETPQAPKPTAQRKAPLGDREWLKKTIGDNEQLEPMEIARQWQRIDNATQDEIDALLDKHYTGGAKHFRKVRSEAPTADQLAATEAARKRAIGEAVAPKPPIRSTGKPVVEEEATTTRAALQKQYDELQAEFNQRGKWHEHEQAAKVLQEDEDWRKLVDSYAKPEREALDRAIERATQFPERVVINSKTGERLRGAEGFVRGVKRKVTDDPLPNQLFDPRNPELSEDEAIKLVVRERDRVIADRQAQLNTVIDQFEATEKMAPELKKQARAAVRADTIAEFQPTLDNLQAQRTESAKALGLMAGQQKSAEARFAQQQQILDEVIPRISDRKQLTEYRALLKSISQDIGAATTNPRNAKTPSEMLGVVDDLGALMTENPLMDQATLNATEGQLHLLAQELQRVEGHDLTANQLRGMARTAAADKNFGKVMVAGLGNGWSMLRKSKDLLPEAGDILIDSQLHQMFQNVYNAIDNPNWLGRWFNEATNLFKTYATLTPGFHVRNLMSGLFMNASDGVGLAHQIEGMKLWREFSIAEPGWLERQPQRVRDAFDATFGSGAGGRYTESEVLGQTQSKVLDRIINNWPTRKSAAAGQRVEGSMRLGMALNSIDRGDSIHQTLARITRIHFDYSQVSKLDQQMKRIIPFWTFMSRNLPLQITQMWMSPAAYRVYDAAVTNFSAPNDEFTPEYWDKLGTWNTGIKVGSMPLYFQPDFGFTRMNSDISALTSPGAFLGNVNPVLAAPIDFAMKRDSFYQREFGPTDYTKQSGILGTPLTALAKMLPGDQTNEAGQVSDNLTNLIRGLVPPVDQAARLFPGFSLGGGGDPDRQIEAMVRYLGAPVRTLSPKQIETEKKNRIYDARDELARKRAMAQAIMAS